MQAKHYKLWSRRSALQTLALGAGSVAFGASYERELGFLNRSARAALSGPPKRLLIVFNHNGIPQYHPWEETWVKNGATPETFEFRPITKPMEKHRKNIVFFDNMFFGTDVDNGDTHDGGACLALTGTGATWIGKDLAPGSQNLSGGESIDIYLGKKIGSIATPQFPSLQLAGQAFKSYVSRLADGTQTSAILSPYVAYQKLFEQIPDGGSVKAPDQALLDRLMVRKSVLDAVAKDATTLRTRLPSEDRARMDAQLDAVRTLEQRLAAMGMPTQQTATCVKPTLPTIPDVNDTKRWPELRRAFSDLIVATLACDRSRVVLMNWRAGGENRIPCDFDPINTKDYEHSLSHATLQQPGDQQFVDLKAWYLGEIAYIADRLAAIPEGDGSMLDNTIVLWTTEISTGHGHGRMPWMSVGGKNMGVNVGRCLKLPTITGSNLPSRPEKGYPHGRLLVSLLNAMGVPDKTFGIPKFSDGPMEGYLRA